MLSPAKVIMDVEKASAAGVKTPSADVPKATVNMPKQSARQKLFYQQEEDPKWYRGETCVLVHCMEESNPWPGFTIQVCGNYYVIQANMYGSKKEFADSTKGKRIRGAIALDGANWHSVTTGNSATSSAIGSYSTTVAKTLLIGGYQTSSGTHGRFFDGTLHEFKVLQGAYSYEECQAWVNAET